MHAQVSLSVAALQTLLESTDTKEKDKGKQENRITNAEENLLNALSNLSGDQSSLEKVKAFSKNVYKAAEQEIKKGNTQYMVDFFIGLQIHCGAVTALHGDIELGLKEIQMYEDLLSECVENKESLQSIPLNKSLIKESSEQSTPLTDFVGQIEEYDETNNLAVAYVLVKAPDTTVLQFLILLSSFVFTEFGEAGWSEDECVASSHQAILDDKYMVQEIVQRASKLFYHKDLGQYIYYFVDSVGKGWAVFIEKYEYKYYQLISVQSGLSFTL